MSSAVVAPEELPVQPEAETGAPPVAEALALTATDGAEADVLPEPIPLPEGTPLPELPQLSTDPAAVSAPQMVEVTDPATGEPTQAYAVPVIDSNTGEVTGAVAVPTTGPQIASITQETVLDDSVRRSAQDFALPVTGLAATAVAPKPDKDRHGLSRGEKILLLGLGALAVGAIISNNRKVAMNSGDRVIVERPDGRYEVLRHDGTLLRQPGSTIRTETFRDGSSRTEVLRSDGSRVVTLYDPEMRVLRRVVIEPDGSRYTLIDDTRGADPIIVSDLPRPRRTTISTRDISADDLDYALADESYTPGRRYSLSQIRQIEAVRALAPEIELDAITFETGSAAIKPDQARALAALGKALQKRIKANPREMFLIEGHTDAVGSAASNLSLSDRRAESVALALTEYFGVPPENMVVQGYGEEFLKIQTQGSERENRRVSLRRITDLLRTAAAN